MTDKNAISISLAGEHFHISVTSPEHEALSKEAVRLLNDLMVKFQNDYQVHDKKKLITMAALQTVTSLLEREKSLTAQCNQFDSKLGIAAALVKKKKAIK